MWPRLSITKCINDYEFKKEVGIIIKIKETSSQFEIAIMHHPVLAILLPQTQVAKMHAQIMHL